MMMMIIPFVYFRSREKYKIRIGSSPLSPQSATATTPQQLLPPSTAKEQQFQSTGRRKELTAAKKQQYNDN